MTSITPFPTPTTPPAALGATVPTMNSPSASDFASLLRDAQSKASSNIFVPGAQSVSRGQLESAIAEVFNAFGFFGRSMSPPPQQTLREVPGGGSAESEPTAAVAPEEAQSPAIQRSVGLAGASAVDPSNLGELRVQAGSPEPGALDRNPIQAAASVVGRKPSGAPRMVPLIESKIPELISEDDSGEPTSTITRALKQTQAETRDQFVFQVGEHTVEVVGRAEQLSSDEERRLLGELESLLTSHGLSLGSATINGQPIHNPLPRSNA